MNYEVFRTPQKMTNSIQYGDVEQKQHHTRNLMRIQRRISIIMQFMWFSGDAYVVFWQKQHRRNTYAVFRRRQHE